MEPYAAVATTGIYCRPSCPSTPNPVNVSGFELAAAAESAGYRACKRCRPYRVPEPIVWVEGPELVCRAVQQILAGALDQGREFDLASRLGVSARHLRRLFRQHLGVTPDGLARSARAHFARRLLDDTDLSVAQVAFASGFGSLRQFNRACLEIFREPPTALRARRRRADRLVADGGLVLRLPFHGPLDWPELLRHLAERAVPGVESVAGTVYRRTIELEGDPGVLELDLEEPEALLLRAHLPHWQELIHLVARARRIANLDLDLDAPLRALGDDPTLGPLMRARPGVRPPGTWDGFETAVQAIVSQGLSADASQRALRKLIARYGKPVPGLEPFGLTHLFPSTVTLATEPLDHLVLGAKRGRAVREFAVGVRDGTLRLDGSLPLEQQVAQLAAIPGVSPETAHYVAFRLGERDAFPLDLVAPLKGRLHETLGADRWRPWRAVAVTHLRLVA
jgi:AraC family transcriptional regulator, regulatory protein of adaptative response / DNA-3-methyladenine glycosylase II